MNHRTIFIELSCILLLVSTFLSQAAFSQANTFLNKPNKIALIVPNEHETLSVHERNDMKSLRESILVSGISFEEIGMDQLYKKPLKSYDLLVLPFASADRLSDKQKKFMIKALRSGVNIFTDSITAFSSAAGIKMAQDAIDVAQIRDNFLPNDTLFWAIPTDVYPIASMPANSKVLSVDNKQKLPLVVKCSVGKGQLIFSSPLFDPYTDKGYSRFSYFIETLNKELGIRYLAHSSEVEMYLDMGMRNGENYDELAKSWQKKHIKRIHASGWYYDDPDTNYPEMIKACHTYGISVYCWLETPMISAGFWNRHPEWREKTATLRDANVDWRKLMNLANEDCRKRAAFELDSFLRVNDWDGINLAELYFEPSPVGPRIPANFTPMNDLVRNDFKNQNGFDPILILDPKSPHYWERNQADWKKLAAYRKKLAFDLKTFFLDHFNAVANQKKDCELMLTVLDVSLTPEVSENIGEDTQNTLALFKKYDISLQVEDPSTCWGMTPNRYEKMGDYYRPIVKKQHQLLFDCNVVGSNERDEVYFPAQKPSGEEIRQICYYMAKSKSRPVFYSEDVVNENDFINMSNVFARELKMEVLSPNKWKINCPKTIYLEASKQDVNVLLDGKTWLAQRNGLVLLPEGEHLLEFAPYTIAAYQLSNFSGNLSSASFSDKQLELSYHEDVISCYASLSKKPYKIIEGNQSLDCIVFPTADGRFTIKLPSGKHVLSILFE